MNKIRLGTRGSQLALAQSRHVAGLIAATNPEIQVEIVIVQTQGDRVLDAPLTQIGGKGVFTKEIESALLDQRIDLAVHSLKDLPTSNTPGLTVAAIPQRESARDVLITPRPRDLDDFTSEDIVGTSSLRRAAQLRARFPHLTIREMRGNVPTRLRKLTDEGYAAIVLAEAGLRRLSLAPPSMQVLDDDIMIPAPGQGALGLQIRADDFPLANILQQLNHPTTAACCIAERTLLDRLGGGCQVPLGAHAIALPDDHLRLRARVASIDGATVIDCEVVGTLSNPIDLGEEAAELLRARGADRIIASTVQIGAPQDNDTAPAQTTHEIRVIVTRDEDADGPLSRELRRVGIVPVCIPLIRTRVLPSPPQLEEAAASGFDWLVLGSANAVQALANASDNVHRAIRAARVACVGNATASALQRDLQVNAHLIGNNGRDELLNQLIPLIGNKSPRVLIAKGNLAPTTVGDTLRAAGATVTTAIVYETTERNDNAPLLRQLLLDRECHAIAFCSASAIEAFAHLIEDAPNILRATNTSIASIGDSTTQAATAHNLPVAIQPPTPTFPDLANTIATTITPSS